MRFTTIAAALILLGGCASIPSPTVQANPNQDAWVLVEDLKWRIGATGHYIVVPAGFVTDYASIPRSFWYLFPPHDRYSRAAVIHDYLYWTQRCTRQQADNIFYIGMVETGVPVATRDALWWGLKTPFGQAAWDENKARRIQGYPKVFPKNLRKMFTETSWPKSQAIARQKGVKDPPANVSSAICSLGNTTAVPAN